MAAHERFLRGWSNAGFEGLLRSAANGGTRLMMHEVNLGEVFYLVAKERDENTAGSILRLIEDLGIETVAVEAEDALRAASIKANHPISYADCFCVNLAVAHAAPVLTGDKDFLELQQARITVEWLGA
ncbi:type II toxin-antitoxin system VapC family toxin [Terriglobus sp.]|uniref:type II toxin-antitoxin system VapC family toxin n=1 Tax=Terriglobus sp. TaxID=1889013 RepID=UPI003B004941